jgi:hypothetical protein
MHNTATPRQPPGMNAYDASDGFADAYYQLSLWVGTNTPDKLSMRPQREQLQVTEARNAVKCIDI